MLLRCTIIFASILFRAVVLKSAKMIETIDTDEKKEETIEKFPHAAFLYVECVINETIKYYCGGAIINQDYIMTAAHCVESCRPDISVIIVGLGATTYSEADTHNVIDVVVHENYNHKQFENDIAILRVKESLKLSKNVQRVYLTKEPPAYDIAEVAGWNTIDKKKGVESLTLEGVQQTVYSVEECKNMLGYLPPKTFCAKFSDFHEEDDTKVNTGSALVIQQFVQIGIVSYKESKVYPELVVYTNVSAHYDWIDDNIVLTTCGLLWNNSRRIGC